MDFNFPGDHVRVYVFLTAGGDRPGSGDYVLTVQGVASGKRGIVACKQQLNHSGGITQIDERQRAQITPAPHPSGHGHAPADIMCREAAAIVSSLHRFSFGSDCMCLL